MQTGRGACSTTAVMGVALLFLLSNQPQQQPNQGPAGTGPASAADHDPLDLDEDEAGIGDNDDPPAAATSTANPINPDEYARLQDAECKREEFERQVG